MTQSESQVKVLNIKKFAEICHTTPRTLRFYEQKGLIRPYAIDPFTKYRSYDARQARDFLRIKLLQNFGIPLNELQELVKNKQLQHKLEQQLKQVKEDLEEKQREYTFLNAMNSFLFEEDMSNVFTKELFPQRKLFCMEVKDADYKDMALYQKQLLDEANRLHLSFGKEQYTFYHTTRYEPKGTKLELAVACDQNRKNLTFASGFSFKQFPKTEALVYTYEGPYEYFSVIYQKLYSYIEQHKIKLTGNVFDVYDLSYKQKSKYAMKTKLVFPVKH